VPLRLSPSSQRVVTLTDGAIRSILRALLILLAAAQCITAQNDFDRELLGRIREHTASSVAGLPNYTCQETMERSIYKSSGRILFHERLLLEVLIVRGGELFAWPGSTEFTMEPLAAWIAGGAIADGNFGSTLHNLFLSSAATFRYAGMETRDQRTPYRLDFHAPLLSSKYHVMVHGKSGSSPDSVIGVKALCESRP